MVSKHTISHLAGTRYGIQNRFGRPRRPSRSHARDASQDGAPNPLLRQTSGKACALPICPQRVTQAERTSNPLGALGGVAPRQPACARKRLVELGSEPEVLSVERSVNR